MAKKVKAKKSKAKKAKVKKATVKKSKAEKSKVNAARKKRSSAGRRAPPRRDSEVTDARPDPTPAPPPNQSATEPSTPPKGNGDTGAQPSAGLRARVRVYRHGLGDCILVRLRQRDETDFKILIDFGVAVATQGATQTMANVLADVMTVTGGS